ncbi:MAG: phosphotransferase [Chloroflexi bacterium]|nr:phosphotransferase [Chloroflexota bacterium]
MLTPHARSAARAAIASASACGLRADDVVVLQDSDKLTLRLLPCDTVARVARVGEQVAAFEVELVQQLAATGSPVVALDPRVEPRVYVRDGFAVTFWTYHEPVSALEIAPAEYADALRRLHAGMRQVDMATPHVTDRVAQARSLVADRSRTPGLSDADRAFLGDTLRTMSRQIQDRGAPEQLLHGEPHPGNVLSTKDGLLFIDFETCCRGPVEFDIAHAPEEVGRQYPNTDRALLRQCRALVLAMVTTWRWNRDDRLPNGRRLAREWLSKLRAMMDGDAR